MKDKIKEIDKVEKKLKVHEESYEKIIERQIEEIQKNNAVKGAVDSIILDIAEFKYDKLYNLMLFIIGISSPVIPITFLFRSDLLEKDNIIYILIITIIINIIIFIFCTIVNRLNRWAKIYLSAKVIEYYMFKIKKINDKLMKQMERNKKIIMRFNRNKSNNKLNRFPRERLIIRNNNKMIKIVDITANKIDIYREKSEKHMEYYRNEISKRKNKEDKKDEIEDFKGAISLNTMVGLVVIIAKSTSFIGVDNINFRYIIIVAMTMYFGYSCRIILKYIASFYISVRVKIYDKLKK